MNESGRRYVSFAGTNIVVAFDGAEARFLVDFLYHDIAAPATGADDVVLEITSHGPEKITISRNGEQLYGEDSPAALANLLVGETIYHLADRSRAGLVFHAGAVSRSGAGVMLPGKTGAGKTTLTAWLVSRGLNYLSDELIYIENDANQFDAFTRPLNVKTSALPLLQKEFNLDPNEHGSLISNGAALVPHRALNPQHHPECPVLRLIIFPEYMTGGTFRLQRLSPAQTGLHLMSCLVNARNLEGHGFQEVVRLSSSVNAYSLQYSNFKQIENGIMAILDSELDA